MLKKITIIDQDTKQLKTEIINTDLIHSVRQAKHLGIELVDTITINYDGRIYNVKEPLDGFMARLNSGLGDELNNRLKSLETLLAQLGTNIDRVETALRLTQNKLIEHIDMVNSNTDKITAEFELVEYKKKPKKKTKPKRKK